MSKFEVSKTVDAVKLNKRTGIPLGEPPIALPFGAIIDAVEENGENLRFTYLTDRYQVKRDILKSAMNPVGTASSAAPAAAASTDPAAPPKPALVFQSMNVQGSSPLTRAKVPGGWLVAGSSTLVFVPDPEHGWDGGSAPA